MSIDPDRPRVLYLSHATPALYATMREIAGDRLDLVTLEADDDQERLDRIAGCDGVIVAAYPLTGAMVEAAGRLRFVHHQGVGYHDTVDLEALRRRGIRLATTPAGTTIGVAEHTLLLTLAVLRRLPFADAELRRGRWHINSLRPESRELRGKTIGYVGMGRIGRAAAARFKAFETKGLYHDPVSGLVAADEARLGVERTTFERLLAQADVVTLHLPLTAGTRHLIGADALAAMRPGAVLINTARGPLVDEAALVAALHRGHLGGAGLDVFETEPPGATPLAEMRNVVLTPHISAGTRDAFIEKMAFLLANLDRFFNGEPVENEVDVEA